MKLRLESSRDQDMCNQQIKVVKDCLTWKVNSIDEDWMILVELPDDEDDHHCDELLVEPLVHWSSLPEVDVGRRLAGILISSTLGRHWILALPENVVMKKIALVYWMLLIVINLVIALKCKYSN